MATETPTVKKPSTRKSPKQVINDRGMKGAIALMVQEALTLGFNNGYEGTVLANKNAKGELLEPTKQSGMQYQLTREGGIIEKLDEKSLTYKNLYAAAKAAHPDMIADEQKYSDKVKAFINFVTTLKAPKESKVSALKSISFN